jgi:HlyD family secretion protein
MNNKMIADMREMSDSREVLSERPHRFVAVFVYILISLIAAAGVWSFIGEIDYYVKAQGEVRPNDAISTIRSAITGRVIEANLEEGKPVRKGELLFRVDTQTQLSTVEILEKQQTDISTEINNLELLRESVIQGENLFDADNPAQSDYYFKYEKYTTDTAVAAEQVRNTNLDFERLRDDARTSNEIAAENRERAASELDALRVLRDSIESGENTILSEETEHMTRFNDYKLKIERYEAVIVQNAETLARLEKLYAAGGAARKDVEAAQFELDSVRLELDSYKSETLLAVTQSISSLEKNLDDLDATIRSAETALASVSGRGYSERLVREKAKLDMLSSISDTLFTLQSNLDALKKDLGSLRLAIDEARIVAPIDGTVSLFSEVNAGDYIQSGTEIAAIIPGTGGDYKMLLAISNADIADIQNGQEIHYRFAAFPFDEYGEMTGRVTKISTDARSNSSGQSYYIADAELDGHILYDKQGEAAEIKVGMTAEARVITRSRKIIFWVLDKLNFLD